MGNRAAITFKKENVSVYLHWNGGRDSVEAMLDACAELGIRSDNYGPARFCQVVGNWFGGGLSLGIGPAGYFDDAASDNGTYYVEHWKIVGRSDGCPHYLADNSSKKYEDIKADLLRINRPIFDKRLGQGENRSLQRAT